MRSSIAIVSVTACVIASAAACVGEVGDARKPGRGSAGQASARPCSKLTTDVIVRSAADMTALPRTGCYDIYGKLTLQGSAVTSLAGLAELNSVNALELDHTGLTAIDSVRPLGIYGGELTVTGNARLANLTQLSFQTAATGILIDSNPALATLDPLGLADPKLEQVDGDIAITGNAALVAVPLGNLSKVTGGVTITGNAGLRLVDLSKLAATGHVELADNAQLTSFTGFAAAAMTTINGDLAVHDNPALATISAMSSLYRITGGLTIANNPALTSLAALASSVRFVDQTLAITNNQNLTDLGALKHLQLVGAITIINNQNLVTCRAIEIDRCVPHPTASVIDNNRDISCNAQCN
jgi:hypothetical protein